MKSPLRILHLEDDPRDAELVRETLETGGIVCHVARVETQPDFIGSLEEGGFDLILADHTLPAFDGLSALTITREKWPHVPFIFVAGTLGEDVAIEALKVGATDYVLKTRLSRLVPSVKRALREAQKRTELNRAEDALRRSEAYLAEAQRLSHTGSFGWDVCSGEICWSQETFRIFEYEPTTSVTIELIVRRTHPEDRSAVQQLVERVSRERKSFDVEHRLLMPDQSVKHLRVVGHPATDESGRFEFVGAVTDITDNKRAEALLTGEKRLLEMIATGVALKDILDALCLIIEGQHSGTLASVLLLRPDGLHLESVAGPTLPKAWARQMEKLPIGPCAGSCGTAAYRGLPVIVSDIATDPLWDVPEHRAAALTHGLRASWSHPILSSEGKVLGTFCMYDRETRSPNAHDLGVMEMATYLARVAIERDCAEEALRRSESFLADGQRISHTGSWGWNLSTGKVIWSDEQCRMLGFDLTKTEPTVELFLARVHSDDKAWVQQILARATTERRAYEMEYRIVLPDGSLKYFKSLGRPVVQKSGDVDEFIGITMDISESKRAENALRASEQVARGQVEALVQSLDILATAPPPEKFIGQMLSTIGRLLNAHSVILWTLDEASDSVALRAAAWETDLAAVEQHHPFVLDPTSWRENQGIQEMLFTGVPQVFDDIEADPRISTALCEYYRSSGTKKFLTIPMLVGSHVNGFISIRHGERPPYQPEEVELAQALAHQAMFAIQLNEFAEQSQQAAVLKERNRMARDIHDTIAQGLTGVIVQLQAAEDASSKGYKKQSREHLQNAQELARLGLREARRSVRALRPQALEEATFWEALKNVIKNTTAGTSVETEFQLRGKMRDLPPVAQENLLHIGQEALTNTLKYARATRFETRLSFNAKEVRLDLRDNGTGFKKNGRHNGFGLTGMRERVEQIGGSLTIASARGKGTKIVVVLPDKQAAVP
jgi:PAS domain S-box-containing protein